MTTKYVSYIRVSTARQGASGLGLEAQQATIEQYIARQGGGRLLREFVEVESGTRADRPQLAEALLHCSLTGSVLLVAKLDRLSRDATFLGAMMNGEVPFVVCDFPDANNFTLRIFAALAEYERDLISQRTKAALGALKDRGVKLGNPGNLTAAAAAAGRQAGTATRSRKSQEMAQKIGPKVVRYRGEGLSLREIAQRLTAEDIQTPGGKGKWDAAAVRSVLLRVGAAA